MKHLIIRNIGPIKEADLELKRFNFIIGSQSSFTVKIDNLRKMHQYEEKDIFLRKIGIL